MSLLPNLYVEGCRFAPFTSNHFLQETAVKVVDLRIKVVELVGALRIDANCRLPLQAWVCITCAAYFVDAVLLEEWHEFEFVRLQQVLNDELELSIHLDDLNQVHFVLKHAVDAAMIFVLLLRARVPRPGLEAAAEVVAESGFHILIPPVAVRFAVLYGLFDLLFVLRLLLVASVFFVFGEHAPHEMTLVAEGLIAVNEPLDHCPNDTCKATDVGKNLV